MATEKQKKIAFVHDAYPAGGAERITSDIASWLGERGYKLYMFVVNLERDKLTDSDNKVFEFIDLPSTDYRSEENTFFITDKLNELSVDIFVIPVTPLSKMDHIKEYSGAKIVFSYHNTPMGEMIVHKFLRRQRKMRGKSFKRKLGYYVSEMWYSATQRRFKMTRNTYRYIYSNCDVLTVLCDEYKSVFQKVLKLGNNNHIEVFNNFIQPKIYIDRPKQKHIVSVGRLTDVDKRIDRLLDIWEKVWKDFPEWKLYIVGEGPEKENLISISKEKGLGNIFFEDYTKSPEVFYQSASILTLTSTLDSWGLVISEGQQAGVVPIAFDCSAGVRYQITPDGVNGFLIRPFDKDMFVQKLRLLMSDETLRNKMMQNVIEKAKEYDMEKQCRNWEALFASLISGEYSH